MPSFVLVKVCIDYKQGRQESYERYTERKQKDDAINVFFKHVDVALFQERGRKKHKVPTVTTEERLLNSNRLIRKISN